MLIEFRQVCFDYNEPGSKVEALKDINLAIDEAEAVGLIGPSGSGKSTLLLHCNGILKPNFGEVLFRGQNIHAKGYAIKALRREVGFLFQFAETNLFGQTVFEDIAYSLRNYGFPENKLKSMVGRVLAQVGLDESLQDRSPFTLSGGEKRKVALAGILATQPKALILDEPTVGLDPASRQEFVELIKGLNSQGITTIMVSHDLQELAKVAKRVLVVSSGQIAADGPVRQVFTDPRLTAWGLELPEVIELGVRLSLKYQGQPVLNEAEVVAAILAGRRRPHV